MHRQPSLTLRLSIYLLVGQLFSFVITTVGVHLAPLISQDPSATIKWHYLAEMRARNYVAGSIMKDASSGLRIDPSSGLRQLDRKSVV
jgi:hypothetical protein